MHGKVVGGMFAAACYQFVRSMGGDSLHAVPSIDQKDAVVPYQLVVKTRKRRWVFFEKATYTPTEFKLNDVMMDTDAFDTKPVTTQTLTEYNRTSKISLKGHFGADIAKEIIDVELEGKDAISLVVKFDPVSKTEVRDPDLMKEISKRNINLDNAYIRQLRADRRKSLCVISGVHFLPNGGTIHRDTDAELDASAKAALIHGASASGDVIYTKGKDIGLAPGTPIAYNLHELNVDKKSGAVQVILTKGTSGGFREGVGYDEVDATSVDSSQPDRRTLYKQDIDNALTACHDVFTPLYSLPPQSRQEVNASLLQLMETPRDLDILADLCSTVEEGRLSTVDVADLTRRLVSPVTVWMSLLSHAGFTGKESLQAPVKDSAILQAVSEVLDAAAELPDNVLALVSSVPASLAASTINTVHAGMNGDRVTCPDVLTDLLSEPVCLNLLLELDYTVSKEEISPPKVLPREIDEVYWILTALYGQ